ncbi:MAG: ABC transporter ATP-binding protein [Anaerolineae bacterium]|nr:ABC transporter ATP-binding protein [Anaerolineae bacterium]
MNNNVEMIKLEHVSRVYDLGKGSRVVAVDDVSLSVYAEEFVCIVGPSGCGKSTLLYLIACLDFPTSGQILIEGQPLRAPNPRVGMVFQPDSVFPWLTVRRNIAFGPELRGLSAEQVDQIANSYIRMVGLEGFEDTLPRQLSGGMKKRVDVARAFANNPEILLMDEPFGALDAMTKERLQLELLRIWDNERKTVLFVTHDLEEALVLGSRVVVMERAPNTIQTVIDVPFERPRDLLLKTSAEFQQYRRMLWDMLHVSAR